tara:strand:+ start:205 stop:1362 length:1158 start_codon:yes stop_codon:yes gene_type:complete
MIKVHGYLAPVEATMEHPAYSEERMHVLQLIELIVPPFIGARGQVVVQAPDGATIEMTIPSTAWPGSMTRVMMPKRSPHAFVPPPAQHVLPSAAAVLAAGEVLFNADLLLVILRKCDARSLARLGRCCQHFLNVGARCWKQHCKRDWPAQAKLPVTDWRRVYSNAARMRANHVIKEDPKSIFDPAHLIFAIEITTAKGSLLLANTFKPNTSAKTSSMFTWDVSKQRMLLKLQNKYDLDTLLDKLQDKRWYISVTVFHTVLGQMRQLLDRVPVDPIDIGEVDEDADATLEDDTLNFSRVTLFAPGPDSELGRPCVRPRLQPFYKRNAAGAVTLIWELQLKFGWQEPTDSRLADDEDADADADDVEFMSNQEILRMLASLDGWRQAE